MEKHTLKVLEYKKIIEELKPYASSIAGKELVNDLQPAFDPKYISARLQEVTEARNMLDEVGSVPFGGIRDLKDIMTRAEKGMVLDGHDLLDISSTLYGARRLHDFLEDLGKDLADLHNPYPHILQIGRRIHVFRPIESAINNAIDQSGEVMDSASPKLRTIRREMRTVSGRVKDKLDGYITNSAYQKMIQDSIVTIRADRYVIPIKSEYKSNFKGIVHDRSSSGQTLFIEPMAVVELNNQLRQLASKEEEEVYRILQEITAKVALEYYRITDTVQVLARLDFIFAKAHYSRALQGAEPELNEVGILELRQARHPLLKNKPVPIDVRLGDGFNTLVITGPNTGGKTVTLKTVGLLTLMVQSGMHIPVDPGSKVSVFKGIYADIGDEQSIEQSLSTFSSHMTQIIGILEKATSSDLVLLDELGAGTDPIEGASLAMSILDYLHQREIRTIATTHYSELKTYAYAEEGVENASVEFDLETLSPTYRLIMGVPGRSNALEIALRLGLPESIIQVARSGLSTDEAVVDQMIKDIEENNRQSFKERTEAQKLKREMERTKADYEKRLKDVENKREQVVTEALEEARQILTKAKNEAEELIKKTRNVGMKEIEKVNLQVKSRFSELDRELHESLKEVRHEESTHRVPEELQEGDAVRIVSLNQKGNVIELLDDDQVVVQAGIMKVTVRKEELERAEKPEEVKERMKFTKISRSKAHNIQARLDLRGARYEEARERTDKYLDDAYLAGLKTVDIIHGKGTGALRNGIHELLKGHHHVKEFRLGGEGEGGSGVTVVTLRA